MQRHITRISSPAGIVLPVCILPFQESRFRLLLRRMIRIVRARLLGVPLLRPSVDHDLTPSGAVQRNLVWFTASTTRRVRGRVGQWHPCPSSAYAAARRARRRPRPSAQDWPHAA